MADKIAVANVLLHGIIAVVGQPLLIHPDDTTNKGTTLWKLL